MKSTLVLRVGSSFSFFLIFKLAMAAVVFVLCCNKIAEAETAVSVNEKKWLVMHV